MTYNAWIEGQSPFKLKWNRTVHTPQGELKTKKLIKVLTPFEFAPKSLSSLKKWEIIESASLVLIMTNH